MPSDRSIPASGHEATAASETSPESTLSALPLPTGGDLAALAEFHQSSGRTVHMLNNLLTALYCQWDLCFPEPGDDTQAPALLLRRTVDLVADEIRTLARLCADYAPAAESARRSAG